MPDSATPIAAATELVTAVPDALATPTISLSGPVDDGMLNTWVGAFSRAVAGSTPLVLALSTTGGDAEIGRRIADDVRLFRDQTGRRALFLGKTMIYSAGATIMGGFLRDDRWLTRDAMIMVHGRKLSKQINYESALRSERPGVEALLAEIDAGIRMESVEFAKFIQGSDVSIEEIQRRTLGNWYIPADVALERRLIAGIL